MYDYLIVGAGFSGAVIAEQLATKGKKRCLVIDRRSHIAGNCFDEPDTVSTILQHRYGPHYFRTNSQSVRKYLSKFTDWLMADYRILSWVDNRYWQFPINLNTFEQLIDRASTPEEMMSTLSEWRVPIDNPKNSEEIIISQVGRKLYEMFFRGYTKKQWKLDPSELDASVCGRIPIRTNRDDRYLSDSFQALPRDGYTALIARILDHSLIDLSLNTTFSEVANKGLWKKIVWTGPIDEYFGYRFGPLPYRSLQFSFETIKQDFYQPVVQVNFPNDFAYTRIVETKHITRQKSEYTTIAREFPDDWHSGKEPYYPVPNIESNELYNKYHNLSKKHSDVYFAGRLAKYKYYNMDQVVALAISMTESLLIENP